MADLPGYQLGSLIYESGRSLVYRAIEDDGGRPVVVKIPWEAYPSPRQLAGYQRAFDLGADVGGDSVIPHLGLVRYRSSAALVTEDYGATSLDRILPPDGLSLDRLLAIGVALARALGVLHAAGIVPQGRQAGQRRDPRGERGPQADRPGDREPAAPGAGRGPGARPPGGDPRLHRSPSRPVA